MDDGFVFESTSVPHSQFADQPVLVILIPYNQLFVSVASSPRRHGVGENIVPYVEAEAPLRSNL